MRFYSKYFYFCGVIFFLLAAGPVQDSKNISTMQKPMAPSAPNTVVFYIKGPVLVSPLDEAVDISGKDRLEFRWKPRSTPYDVYWYIFRLYKGKEMVHKNEIYHEQISGLSSFLEVSTDHFEDGEEYTWVVKQINNGPPLLFSDPVYRSFRIIKKTRIPDNYC